MKPKILVVCGTDTEVGKTVVAEGLGYALCRQGIRTVAVKPIESGCDSSHCEDGVRLAKATGQEAPKGALVRLRAPITPAAAADLEGVELQFDDLMQKTREAGRDSDLLLVEGAGGLLSPLTWQHSTLDMAEALGAETLIVASNTLGTINHTRLTLGTLEARGIHTLGVVLSAAAKEDDGSVASNLASMQRVMPGVSILTLGPVQSPEEAADHLGPLVAMVSESSR